MPDRASRWGSLELITTRFSFDARMQQGTDVLVWPATNVHPLPLRSLDATCRSTTAIPSVFHQPNICNGDSLGRANKVIPDEVRRLLPTASDVMPSLGDKPKRITHKKNGSN